MSKTHDKELKRINRHKRVRKTVSGTEARPRICVHRSLKNFYAQVIDDVNGKIIFGVSTKTKAVREKLKNGSNKEAASALGEHFSSLAREKGLKQACFDRGGYSYHGRVKAFAEAARKGGMEF
ncbi:MAG: 50S ribosomal protein L18 [Candidatus Omnitrophica bacterium]|nr:50S ribosomal protein L18 [Candidatus Omnitrophota bacterium]